MVVRRARKAFGALSIWLGLASLGATLCVRAPELFTMASTRDALPIEILRAAIAAAVLGSVFFGVVAALSGRWRCGALGAGAALVASMLGGGHAALGRSTSDRGILALDWLVLDALLAAFVFIPLEKIAPRRPSPTRRAGWRTDLSYFIVNHLLAHGVAVVGGAAGAICFGWGSGAGTSFARAPIALQVLALLVVTDVAQYFVHRALHEVPFLWRFHAVHHSSAHMDALAGSRVHLLELLATRTVVYLCFAALGFSFSAIGIYGALIAVQATLIHANLRVDFGALEQVLVSPRFHHFHHSSDDEAIDTNYAGTFSFLDRVFGTYHLPACEWPKRFGVVKEAMPASMIGQQLFPFVGPR